MALRYGYFDSDIIGVDDEGMPILDRAETSELFALLFASLVSNGVLALPVDCFRVLAAGGGLSVEVRPGFGMVRGHFAYNNEPMVLELGAAPQKYSRIDRIVLRCNYLERMVEIIVKAGTEAASPVAPALIRPTAGDYYELCLANIRLTAGQKVITQSSITDTRPDSRVCGYITQLIDHLDTSVFFAQFDRFYEEFVKRSNDAYIGWTEQYNAFYRSFVERSNQAYADWTAALTEYLQGLQATGNSQVQTIVNTLEAFETAAEAEFREWFQKIRDQLGEDPAGNLQNQVTNLTQRLALVEQMLISGIVYTSLATEDGEELAAENGDILEAYWPICQCMDNNGAIRV